MAVDDAQTPENAPEKASETSPAPATSPASTEPQTDPGEVHDPERQAASREAANYRTRLRAAEAEVEQRERVIVGLREEVDRLHRAEAERIAGEASMASPGDLWLVTDLADLRDEAGRLDVEKVNAKVDGVLADRPSWRVRVPSFDGGARQTPPQSRTPGLADLLKPEARR